MRVVSLVPSATETLLSWGVDVVACTRFCDQPDIVHVGGTKDPDLAAIAALAPDLVVMDREENRKEDADALRGRGVAVFATDVVALETLGEELARLAATVSVAPSPLEVGPPRPRECTALVLIWRRPWMALGPDTYGSTVLAHLGVANPLPSGERYPEVRLGELKPDAVLLPSEPYPFGERHVAEVRAALGGVPALLVDGRDLFWWGTRTPAAIERLRRQLGVLTTC